MRVLLEQILQQLTESADQVRITEVQGAKTLAFEVTVPKAEFGKVIGRGGKTVAAIRNLLQCIGTKDNQRVMLEVVESAA